MSKPAAPHLRLVKPPEIEKAISGYDFGSPNAQGTLFASEHPTLAMFAQFDELSDADLIALLVTASPRLVFDARLVPRFDVGSINRRLIFSLFQKIGAEYLDIFGAIGKSVDSRAIVNGDLLGAALVSKVMNNEKKSYGPVLILVDERQAGEEFLRAFVSHLDRAVESGWEVMRVPEIRPRPASDKRDVLFISHATPNDNDFAKWLAAQLQLLGYEVWVDLDRLVGGETFWDEIENVIRVKAAKVLIAASQLAQSRNGVLDEISLAVSVERAHGLENFVIPLRIDDLPYDQFRVNIARKNIINFTDNWANGLSALIKVLERDRIPKCVASELGVLARAIHSRAVEPQTIESIPERLLLNWLDVVSLPTAISFYQSRSGGALKIDTEKAPPHVSFANGLISFANPHVMEEHSVNRGGSKRVASLLTKEFLKGLQPELPRMERSEARKILSNLLRQGWDRKARQVGLCSYELASGAIAWFAPDGLIPGNAGHFADETGKKRRKTLVGYSAKRRVFWHFAVELRLAPGYPLRLIVRPHVVFSEDGKSPLKSVARLHALRRGFCKTWWNDRWRDLLVSYMTWLGEGRDHMALQMGAQEMLLVSTKFATAVSPVSIPSDKDQPFLEESSQLDNDVSDVDIDEDEARALEQPSCTSDHHHSKEK